MLGLKLISQQTTSLETLNTAETRLIYSSRKHDKVDADETTVIRAAQKKQQNLADQLLRQLDLLNAVHFRSTYAHCTPICRGYLALDDKFPFQRVILLAALNSYSNGIRFACLEDARLFIVIHIVLSTCELFLYNFFKNF